MSDEKWYSLRREDFEHALDEMGAVVDVTVSDLILITDRARQHAQMRRTETLFAKNLMTRPVHTVTRDTPLSEAAELLLANRISGAPVVDQLNHLVGLVTEADLLTAVGLPCHHVTHNLWQTLQGVFSRPIELREPNETVGAVMVSNVVTVRPEESVNDILELMKAHHVKRLVVIDQERIPLGIITRSNLVRAFFERIRPAQVSMLDH